MNVFTAMNQATVAPAAVARDKVKRVVRIVDGEMRDARNPDIVYCEPPVQGQTCPKCVGTQRVVFFTTKEVHVCFWCSDGRGVISVNDMHNYRRRLRLKLEMCYIRTYIPRLAALVLD